MSVNNQSSILVTAIPSEPRTDARVTFSDGRIFSAPVNTPLSVYVDAGFPSDHPEYPILGALVDNRLTELTTIVNRDVRVTPLSIHNSDGSRMYRRSLTFLLTTAADEVFPGTKIAIEHSVPSGGYYCELIGRPNFTIQELRAVEKRMREIVAENVPFERKTIPLEEAVAYFTKRGDDDKVRLLESRTKNYLTVYELHNNIDYFFGYMVPSTGTLTLFSLHLSAEGFVLEYARPETPKDVHAYQASYKLESVFRQTKDWLRVMDLEDVGRLNQRIADGSIREEILITEALHSRYVEETAHVIAQQHKTGTRLVLIAGPSSAGKTTFSKRLAVQLMAHGVQPFTLEMDNYFIDRELTPKDETGAYDFEALRALNLPRFNQNLLALMNNEEVQLPKFDFKQGKSLPGEIIRLTDAHIIIAEGIHGMNPDLVKEIPPQRIFRIYVSALTTLNLDRHNRIPTTDVRLLRRIVRDAATRGYSAQDTLDRWESVRRGEKRYIFPFQENANVMFNSSLAYELSVLRPFAEPLLRQVDIDSPRYVEAKRLLAFLGWVRPASPELVPNDSLVREFIGGSILETYLPGKRQLSAPIASNGKEKRD